MKNSKYTLIIIMLGSIVAVAPANAQTLQSVQTTQTGVQQGRTLLDSDTSEADTQSGWTDYNISDPGVADDPNTDTGTDLEAPEDPVESADMFLKIEGIEGESEDAGDPDRPVIIGDVPDPDDASTVQYKESDFNFASDPEDPPEAADMFLKLDGIDGESEDTSAMNKADLVTETAGNKGGNAETTWKVEKGEKASAKKPKEIVVVGSKVREAIAAGVAVRGWDPVTKKVIIKTEDVHNEEDLTDYAAALLGSSDDIATLSVNDDNVIALTFDRPVKLFGLFAVSMEHRAEVSSDPNEVGRVKVRFPWWSFLATKDISSDEIKEAVEAELRDDSGDAFETLGSTMRTLHDTAMAIIRKEG